MPTALVIENEASSSYLFVVALVNKQGGFACGGILINSRHLITAHCVKGTGKVVVGRNDLIRNGKNYSVKDFVSHPNYTRLPSPANDIAVIILSEDVSEVTEFPKRATAELDDYDTFCKALGKGSSSFLGNLSRKLKLWYSQNSNYLTPPSEKRNTSSKRDYLVPSALFLNPESPGNSGLFTQVYFFNYWIDSAINDN
ncbi:hypothetical protein MTP99_006813 [Tenebrio molitor]|nr:hypothetical protein MTP99_006813 [Tenebrio molitor]